MLSVVIDIDGVIAVPDRENKYERCTVVPGAVEAMTLLCEYAHVTLHTARWEADREVTEKWLADNKVPYHRLVMDKPLADVYVDDRALLHTDWSTTMEELAWEIRQKTESEILTR